MIDFFVVAIHSLFKSLMTGNWEFNLPELNAVAEVVKVEGDNAVDVVIVEVSCSWCEVNTVVVVVVKVDGDEAEADTTLSSDVVSGFNDVS